MSITTAFGRLGNQIIRNMAASFIACKNDLNIEYSSHEIIQSIGINLYVGKNKYSKTLKVTDDNYINVLNMKEKLEYNINLNHNFFQTEEITNMIRNHLVENRDFIIKANSFSGRYRNNSDIFIQ